MHCVWLIKKALPTIAQQRKNLPFPLGSIHGNSHLFNCDNGRQNTWKFATTIRIPKKNDETNVNFEVIKS
jgi:hypothetical protein